MAKAKTYIYADSPDLIALRMEIEKQHPILRSKSNTLVFEELEASFRNIIIEAARVEKVASKALRYEILEKANNKGIILSEMTIKRLYGHKKTKEGANKSMFEPDTLDLFAIVGGYLSWNDYLNTKFNPYGQYFSLHKAKSSLMEIGQLYIIGWYPHKYVKLLYLGDNQFRIIDSSRRGVYAEDRIIKADSFDFRHIMELDSFGYPLYPSIFYINNEKETMFDFDSIE